MSYVCTCGLLKVRKVGTSTVDGIDVCNNCGRPIEFGAVPATGAEGHTPAPDGASRTSEYPLSWVIWGALLILISLLVATIVISNGGPTVILFLTEIGSIAGFLMLLVGVIAKGVAIGLTTDRRSK